MIREILQYALPIIAWVCVSLMVARSAGSPLWHALLAIAGLVGIAAALAKLIYWLY